ncbi:MAG: hypothetical protein Kow00122_07880 [Thermoleophilia bacterium]
MFGALALFGPPAFGIRVGFLSGVYALALFVYALWALRLTVVFRDDDGLGYLLSLFDGVFTLPLLLWGSERRLAPAVIGLWVGGLAVSVAARRRERSRIRERQSAVDEVTGLGGPGLFARAVDDEGQLAAARRSCFGLVTVRVHRYEEMAAYYGREAAERAVAALGRRTLRELGSEGEGFRLAPDVLAFLVPGCGSVRSAELAAAVSRAVNSRLVDGRRVDCFVGYAVGPRDGVTAAALLHAAECTSPARTGVRPAGIGRVAVGGSRVAVG